MRILSLVPAFAAFIFAHASYTQGGFTFDLDFNGNGQVTKQLPAPVQVFTTDTSNIDVSTSTVTLVASGRQLSPGAISDQSIQFGDNLNIALTNLIQGTKFALWSGPGIPAPIPPVLDALNPILVYQDPVSPFTPVITATFDNLTIDSTVLVNVNGNVVNGTLTGSNVFVSWDDLSSFVNVGGSNAIILTLSDSAGSGSSGFDLDVFSPSSVPEPTGLLLLGGVMGAGFFARRRLKKNA